jgi:type VI secretion system Hcp family effector
MSGRVYLKLKAGGADIEGESTVNTIGGVDVSKTIECDGFSEKVTTAQDRASRRPTGQRIYEAVTIRKWVDKASPELQKALCDTMPCEGEFLFFRPALEDKRMEHFFTVKMERARVSAISRFLPKDDKEGDVAATGKPPMEEVSFVFGRITWSHVPAGKEHTDDWQEQS